MKSSVVAVALERSDQRNAHVVNNDLVWQFNFNRRRERAIKFITQFRDYFPVYSGSVQQLFTSYTMDFTKDSKIIILPDPKLHHNTFFGIDEEAIRPTGLIIVPQNDTARPLLKIPFKSKGKLTYACIPLANGIRIIQKQREGKRHPFLPILCKGDLRQLDDLTPCLHLHTINPGHLTARSMFEQYQIQNSIANRLDAIMSNEEFSININKSPLFNSLITEKK